jgi:hypothetical protein
MAIGDEQTRQTLAMAIPVAAADLQLVSTELPRNKVGTGRLTTILTSI